MTITNFKDEMYNSKMQVVQISSEGKILESDDSIFKIKIGDSIIKIHPFFEGIAPLYQEISEKVHFPCVNLTIKSKEIIADIDLVHEKNKVFLLIFDFTDHYRVSHPLVQEKNEASILRNKLTFEREILVAKEDLKNKFLSYINHEIRNPLNNLVGFMDILDKSKLDYEQKETLNVMNKIGNHIKILLDDLVDISKIEKGLTEIKDIPFSLSQIINNLIKHFQIKYEKSGIQLSHQFDKDVPIRLIGDPTRLNQILFNLLDNAYKNTKKGTISIGVALKEKKADNKVSIHFTVSDTGKGIPQENIPHIFDTYHQLKFNEINPIGEGLGLKIVKELVNLLKGTIKIDSTEGEGTTYNIMLPFVEREKKSATKKSVPKGTGIVISKRILVVENEGIAQMLMMKTFLDNDDGYLIELARDGSHAMELLDKRKYHMIMTKTNLPDMKGHELIGNIRNHNNKQVQKLPILVVSGSTMTDEKESILSSGASAFLSKPYTKKELFSKIDVVLNA